MIEEDEIRKNVDLFTESYGKSIFDVIHNIDLELKRKYKYRFWIKENAPYIVIFLSVILFFLLQYVVNKVLSPPDMKTGLLYFFSITIFVIVLYYVLKKIVGQATPKIVEYEMYIKEVVKDEVSKRTKKEGGYI
jgi:hypothetical protein